MKTYGCFAIVSWLAFLPAGALADEPSPPNAKPVSPPAESSAVDPATKRVRLEFRDQEWLGVLQWLAEQSELNLDWQQMPEGTLNLSSSKEYALEDAHDVINMQLLARGFTTLVQGEVLRLAKLEGLDPTLVARVEPDDLAKLPQHRFVRVSFPLNWMIAEEAAEEFSPLMSPYGQLHPMASTNRLEVMDVVVNLRELRRLLTRAESDEGRRERVVEFAIEHRRAEDIALKVRQLLGLPAAEVPAAATLTQLDLEKTKLRSEAIKQLGAAAQPLLTDKPDIQLVVNEEENSILVHGRSDKIELARQAIKALDKPLAPKESPWEQAGRMKIYEIKGFDADTIVRLVLSMQEEGKIDKQTRITHEATYNRLVVFATPDDHLTIATLLQKFTAETEGHASLIKTYEVKGFDASTVTELIQTMQQEGRIDKQTRVTHEATYNRLVVFATPDDHLTIATLLQKFTAQTEGHASLIKTYEVKGFDASTVTQLIETMQQEGKIDKRTRVTHEAAYNRLVVSGAAGDHAAIAELLQKFTAESRQAAVISLVSLEPQYAASAVQAVLKNPDRPSAAPGAASNGNFQIEPDPKNDRLLLWATPKETVEVRSFLQKLGETFVDVTSQQRLHVVPTRGMQLATIESQLYQVWSQVSDAPLVIEKLPVSRAPVPDTEPAPAAETPPKGDRSTARQGQTFLVTQTATDSDTPPGPATVRIIESTDGKVIISSDDPKAAAAARALLEGMLPPAGEVHLVKLEHAEAEDVEAQLTAILEQAGPAPNSKLSPAASFSIDVDARTNSLIIQNVSDEQRAIVDKMVRVLDAPAPKDDDLQRIQRIYQVQNAKVAELSETLKEIYRDLLSKSDKTFANNKAHNVLGFSGKATARQKKAEYQGLLSISANQESNTLIISAPTYLMEEVLDLAKQLDTDPADSSIGIVHLSPGMDTEAIMKALGGVLEEKRRR